MFNWYRPGLPFTSETPDLLRKWAADHEISEEDLNTLTREEVEAAAEALQSLAYWFSAPIKSDLTNPYWMENQEFSEARRDTKVLRVLEEQLRDRAARRGRSND